MKKILAVFALLTFIVQPAAAQVSNVAGKWKAEFDTQIGVQKYLFTLEQQGATLKGAANADVAGQQHDVVLSDVKLSRDTLTFTETMDFQGNTIPITYTGIVAGDQIAFTRKVGDFATETFVAKREKGGA